MAEYIEKNVAIARLTALEIGNPCATMTDAKQQIADTRTADVASVVRCMDCRYRGLICCPAMHEIMGNGLVDYAVDDGYCWCGKLRED